jgi:REP element-mobilizing transposase RayT
MGNASRPTAPGLYHLVTRSSTPELLFTDGPDRLSMIGQLERVTLDTDWTCIAAVLMGTHYHLIVDAGERVLADAMKRINWAYAVNHNKRHHRRGHRVGCRYLSKPIESEAYLLGCYRYVVRNPVEARLCERPEQWPGSSYASTIELSSAFPFVDATLVLDHLDPDHETAIARLRGLCENPLTPYGHDLPVAVRPTSRDEVSDTPGVPGVRHLR